MKKVPQGFDFSFLNEEEARKILQVLERNEELRRAEKDRIRYEANSELLLLGWACILLVSQGTEGHLLGPCAGAAWGGKREPT